MEVGSIVKTLVDKKTEERGINIFIPKGTEGVICEIHENWVFVEIEIKELPEGIGVIDYDIVDIEEIK